MAFVIKHIKSAFSQEAIYTAILFAMSNSRFSARVENNRGRICIYDVRLLKAKDYCGNHPLPCPVRAFPTKHKKMNYLEGADWVAFNDMLNDVLDKMSTSASVASSHVIIRKGDKRCVEYTPHPLGNGANEWQKDSGYFANMIGKQAPRSKYPNGTPGIPEYLPALANTYQILDHDHHDHKWTRSEVNNMVAAESYD